VNNRRTLILIAAIAIGALSSFLVWNYVNGVQDQAYSNAERVPVYLVKTAISRGTPGLEAQASISREDIPRKFKPANAITSLEDISGKVALNDLVPNQVVVSDMFVDASDPNARASFSDGIGRIRNEDQVAITITVDPVHGVGGFIQPGDFVNINLAHPASGAAAGAGSTTGAAGTASFVGESRSLFQKAQVLAVGSQTIPQPGQATAAAASATPAATANNAGLITLIVPASAAQYLQAANSQDIYLTLVAPDYKPTPMPPLGTNPPLPGEQSGQLTPYGPKGPDSAS
jgi:Flp pilus assembly protein CpaB